MGRNRIEIGARIVFITALLGMAGCAPKPNREAIAEPIKGIEQSAPPVEPSPTIAMPSPAPKESVPVEVSMLMRNYHLQEWRKGLPIDYDVTIIDYGLARHLGVVLPEEGLKLRQFPSISSKPATEVKWLDWGQEISFRNLIFIFNKKTGEEESWVVVDERTQRGARWYCPVGPRGHGRCFAAAKIGDEELIDLAVIAPPPVEDITFHKWPR